MHCLTLGHVIDLQPDLQLSPDLVLEGLVVGIPTVVSNGIYSEVFSSEWLILQTSFVPSDFLIWKVLCSKGFLFGLFQFKDQRTKYNSVKWHSEQKPFGINNVRNKRQTVVPRSFYLPSMICTRILRVIYLHWAPNIYACLCSTTYTSGKWKPYFYLLKIDVESP